jgi:hypothetical protein
MQVVNSDAQVPHSNRGNDRGCRLTDYEVLVGAVNLLNNQHVQSACIEQESVGVFGSDLAWRTAFEAVSLSGASRK